MNHLWEPGEDELAGLGAGGGMLLPAAASPGAGGGMQVPGIAGPGE